MSLERRIDETLFRELDFQLLHKTAEAYNKNSVKMLLAL